MKKMVQLMKEAAEAVPAPMHASSRLKSRILSRLIALEQAEGPLRVLSANQANGDEICVFEKVLALMPSENVQSRNLCAVCHARVLGERVENAPISWRGCPYAQFCSH